MSDRSRLVVLALPSHLTKEQLLAHLSSLQLPLTDVKLLVNKEGRFRRIAFLGYRSNEDAQKAKDWFDGTWLGGSRIRVEYANESTDLSTGFRQTSPSQQGRASQGQNPGETLQAEISAQGDGPDNNEAAIPVEGLDDDAAYLAKRLKRTVGSDMPKGDEQDGAEQSPITKDAATTEIIQHVDGKNKAVVSDGSAASTTRLFLRNLSFAVTEADLDTTLRQYGKVEELYIPRASSGQNKGIGFVQYAEASEANAARQALDGKPLCGRLLHVLPASAKLSSGAASEDGLRHDPASSGSFKQRKKAKLSSQADDSFNWGALYMNSDAVMDSLANRYGVSKATLLDPTNSDAAARMALAESFIIQETRDYLSENGVDVECFASTSGTSDTTLLLKNLPAGSSVNTIRSLTADHGPVRRVLVPPAGTIAVVEFDEPTKTKQALQSLAYRRLGNSVIYVQKAPAAIWNPEGTTSKSVATEPLAPLAPANTAQNVAASKNRVLFVANLPVATTTAELRTVFQVFKGLDYAKVTVADKPTDAESKLARQKGHHIGFVGFKTQEDADRARIAMDGHILSGNVLSVKFAKDKVEEDLATEAAASVSSSKLLIKNLPFETNRKELLSVVSPYGKIMSLRVPRNAQSRSRGFAFVQYSSAKEASAAKQGLAHTHILGRHVIVEQAE